MEEDTELSVRSNEAEKLGICPVGRVEDWRVAPKRPSLPNQVPLVPSDALNVRTVTVTRRTWESTATSAR